MTELQCSSGAGKRSTHVKQEKQSNADRQTHLQYGQVLKPARSSVMNRPASNQQAVNEHAQQAREQENNTGQRKAINEETAKKQAFWQALCGRERADWHDRQGTAMQKTHSRICHGM